LGEDRSFEIAQGCRWFQSELLDHGPPSSLEGPEGLGLLPRLVEREH
jgi:hypothetical protein